MSTITVSKRGRRWPKGAPTDRKLFNLTGGGETQATDRAMLDERIKALRETANSATTTNYLRAEWRFRVACYQIPNRERLLNEVKNLRELSERYLKLAYQNAENMHESLRFHIKLFDAIAANDEVRAEAINIDALRWTLTRAGGLVRHKLYRSSQ